jgi:hypothetical protein
MAVFAAVMLTCPAIAGDPGELVRLRKEFNSRFAKDSEALAVFWRVYTGKLAELEQAAKGDFAIDAIPAIQAEMKNAQSGLVGQNATYAPLRDLQRSYGRIYAQLLQQFEPQRLKTISFYTGELENLEKSFRQQKRPEDAYKIHAEYTALQKGNIPTKPPVAQALVVANSSAVRQTPVAVVPSPAKSLTSSGPKVGQPQPGSVLAKVEIEDSSALKLEKDVVIYGDSEKYKWTDIPGYFNGFEFTQNGGKSHKSPYLKFKVTSDGLVYMACSTRGKRSGNGKDWQRELTSEEDLYAAGWQSLADTFDLKSNEGFTRRIYFRTCKSGETFSYRTEKYVAPTLLLKQ